MQHIKYIIFFIALILSAQLCIGQKKELPYKILYINSYNTGYSWSDEVTKGLMDYYYQRNDSFQIFAEFMDAKRHSTLAAEKWFYPYLQSKYSDKKFDILLVSDNAALDFVIKYNSSSIIKGLPIMFCGISNPKDYPLKEMNLYGVYETNSFIQSFELIRDIYPNFDTLYAFMDRTETGEIYKKQTIEFLKKFPQYKVKFVDSIYIDNISDIVTNFTQNNIIFYYGVSIDGSNKSVDHFHVLEKMTEASKIPLFSSYIADTKGPLGGRYSSGVDHGKALAELAYKKLTGLPIKERIKHPPAHSVIDYLKLKQLKLNPDLIPEKTIVRNKPDNIIKKYKTYIATNLLITVLLIIIIVFLFRSYKIQKRSKIMIEMARDKAYESDNLKGSFLANVSHELRTPLNAICGFAELSKAWNTQDEIQEYLNLIYSNSEILAQLVNDLLDISMIDGNAIKIKKSTIELKKLFNNLQFQGKSLLKSNEKDNIDLKIDIDHTYQSISGDDLRISQVMLNFINNAIKFTDKGTITIGYKHIESFPKVKKLFPLTHSALVFFVKDTGIGIKPEKQKLVFDRFRRIDTKYLSQHGGVGLGLNISKSLVDLMDGQVFLFSEPHKGSTFGFYLNI